MDAVIYEVALTKLDLHVAIGCVVVPLIILLVMIKFIPPFHFHAQLLLIFITSCYLSPKIDQHSDCLSFIFSTTLNKG